MPDNNIISNNIREDHTCAVIGNTLDYFQELFVFGVGSRDSVLSVATMARNEENTLSRATGLSTRWCPSCSKTGRQVKLKLCQINLEEAMYLCTKEKCRYPFSPAHCKASIIQRPFTQIKLGSKKRKRKHLLPLTLTRKRQKKATQSQNLLPLSTRNAPSVNNFSALTPYVKHEPTIIDDAFLDDIFQPINHKQSTTIDDAFLNDIFDQCLSKNDFNQSSNVKDKPSSNFIADSENLKSSCDNTKDTVCLEKRCAVSAACLKPVHTALRKKQSRALVLSLDHDKEPALYNDPLKAIADKDAACSEKSLGRDHPALKVDLEMLAQACEELKSAPSSPVLARTSEEEPRRFRFDPNRAKAIYVLPPCNDSPAVLPLSHRSLNTSTTHSIKNASASKSFPSDFYYKDVPKKRSRSKLAHHITFEPPGRKRVFRLTGQRRTNLYLLRPETSRVRAAVEPFFSQPQNEETSSLASSDKSSELSALSDFLPDLDVFGNGSEFNDSISDFDLYLDDLSL